MPTVPLVNTILGESYIGEVLFKNVFMGWEKFHFECSITKTFSCGGRFQLIIFRNVFMWWEVSADYLNFLMWREVSADYFQNVCMWLERFSSIILFSKRFLVVGVFIVDHSVSKTFSTLLISETFSCNKSRFISIIILLSNGLF